MSRERQSIQVTIRLRPLSEKDLSEDSRLCLKTDHETRSITMLSGNDSKKFIFDQICENDTQEDVFQKVGRKSTIDCIEGYNCTVFAYGQTGAGKTYTMMGINDENEQSYERRGLIPRTLQYLFQCIDEDIYKNRTQYLIRCYFLQIYNEQIIDLLNKSNSNLQLREDIKKGVYVEGVEEQTITRTEQAMDILKKGSKGRHVGSTFYNQASSRSHSVFTMLIESRENKINGVINTKTRHFHFIDLAGSQRTKQSMGQRLKEGCSINKSLHVLGNVINSLAEYTEGKTKHVNYRDSKLTFLLKDSLGGNSKTHLIANIHIGAQAYHETMSTLSFARRVKLIKLNKVSINQDASGNIEALKGEIKRLKDQIIRIREVNLPLQNQSIDSNNQSQISPGVTTILHRYVTQELEKQTKLQFQISKLHARINHLQQGIKHYAQNQSHLRMIISIYDDKFARNKKVQQQLQKMVQSNQESQEIQKITQYFKQQRQNLIKQVNILKQMGIKNGGVIRLIKAALQDGKLEGQEDQLLIQAIHKNSQLLAEIKKYIGDQFETNPNQIHISEIKEKQYIAQKIELQEKVQQLTLELGQLKNQNEENQVLLKESVDTQITLEKDFEILKMLNQEKQELKNQLTQKCQKLQKLLSQTETKYQSMIIKITTQLENLKNSNHQYTQQIITLKSKIVEDQFQKKQKLLEKIEYQDQIISLKKKIKENQIKSQKEQIQISSTRQNLNKQISQNIEISNQVKSAHEKIMIKESQIAQLQTNFVKIKENYQQKLRIKLQQYQNEKEKLLSEVSKQNQQLKNQMQDKQNELNSIQFRSKDIQKKYEEQITTNKNLQQSIRQAKQKHNDQLQKLKELHQVQNREFQNKIAYMEEKIKDLQLKSQEVQKESKKIKENSQINEATLVERYNLEIQNLKSTEEEIKTLLNSKIEQIEQVKLQLSEIQTRLIKANKDYQQEKNNNLSITKLINQTSQSQLVQIQRLKIENQKISLQFKQKLQYIAIQQLKIVSLNEQITMEVSQNQERISNLEQSLRSKDQQRKNIQIKLQDIVKDSQAAQKMFNEKIQQLQLHQSQLLSKNQVKEELIQQLTAQNTKLVNNIQSQSQRAKKEKRKFIEQLSQKDNNILALEQQKQAITKNLQFKLQQFKEYQERQTKYQQSINLLKIDLKEKQNSLIKLQLNFQKSAIQQQQASEKTKEKHKYQCQMLQNKIAQLKDEVVSVKQSYQRVQKQANCLSIQNQEYKKQIIQFKDLIKELTEENLNKTEINNQVKEQLNDMTNKLQCSQNQKHRFEQELHKAEKSLNQIKKEQSKSEKQLNGVIGQKKDTQDQMNKMKVKFDEKSKQLQENVKQEMKKAEQIEQKYLTEIMQKSSLINEMRTSLIQTQEGQKRYQQTIKSLRNDLNICQQKFQQQIKDLTSSLISKEDELKIIKRQLSKERELHLHTQLQLQSYDNLQQIKTTLEFEIEHTKRLNTQLNATNTAQNAKMTQLRQYSQKLQSQAQENKHIVENLKLLISNSENQKIQLEVELSEKDSIYKRLVQKIANTEDKGIPTSSQHYLKTVQLLQKSRHELIQSKKQNEEQKKMLKKLKQEITQKQDQVLSITSKAQEYCRNQQSQLKSIQNDYMKLEGQCQSLLLQKGLFEEMKLQNESVRQEIKAHKIASSRSSLKIQQLEDKNRILLQQKQDLQNDYEDLKKQLLRNGNGDNDSKMMYINQLKEEKTILKRQNQILSEQLARESEQKLKLKSDKRLTGTLGNNVAQINSFKIQLQKRNSQVKYLQEIIAEALNMLGVRRVDSKYKSQSIRSNLIIGLKDLLNQLETHKDRVKQLTHQNQNKEMKLELAQKQFAHYKAKSTNSKDFKELSPNLSNNDSSVLCNVIRNKMFKVQNDFTSIKQSMEERNNPSNPLKLKDVNSTFKKA